MRNLDEPAADTVNKTVENQPIAQNELPAFHQLFTHKFAALLLTLSITVGLTTFLFYQNSVENHALIENQLQPISLQLKQIKALQSANELMSQLLSGNKAENFVELHTQLIAIDNQLLQLNSSNEQLFQQWLQQNQLAEDVVSRIQGSHVRNQQLKQSSIIQLQLMIFSLTPIIDKKLTQQNSLQKQLQAEQGRVSFSKADAYLKTAQQLSDLQQLQDLLVKVSVSFEQLTMYSPIANFELLRLNIAQIFVQSNLLNTDSNIATMAGVNQQIETFEQIVLTEQRALAKWQGYIRLAQDYHVNLTAQQQQINQLLLAPYEPKQAEKVNVMQALLTQFNIHLSDKNITIILVVVIILLLLIFCSVLWQLRAQIRLSAQQGVAIIHGSLQQNAANIVVANCAETQAILTQMHSITKPEHNEQEFQLLSEQYQSSQLLVEQKNQNLAQLEQCNEQQKRDDKEHIGDHLSNELQRYQYLAAVTLSLLQQQQAVAFNLAPFNKDALITNDNINLTTKLTELYQQLTQFYLVLEIQCDNSVLTLTDINLVDEIHAILFNKQKQQQYEHNQLFVSFDEQLLSQTKVDFRLFQQLISLLVDITLDLPLDLSLDKCQPSQFHLQLQLQDKSAGQQLVRFIVKVKKPSLETLPDLITQLLTLQSSTAVDSPLIGIFNILLAKQYGENLVAQLTDDGYQVSFELPLTIVASSNDSNKDSLENIAVLLLSNNNLLAQLLANNVLSAKGKFEHLARIDSFEQQVNAKHLTRQKLDLLIVASDMALTHLDLITKQISALPHSLQPKLMVLQSNELSYQQFGFYCQAEQLLCKDSFLHNIKTLLVSEQLNNQLFPSESFTKNEYIDNGLSLLLGVQSPEHSQNLQRLLQWLGFQVHIVAHQAAQQLLWQSGQYNLLITEFSQSALVEMTSKPLIKVGVFSLTTAIAQTKESSYFEHWQLGKFTKESTLAELVTGLAPWLKQVQVTENTSNNHGNNNNESTLPTDSVEDSAEIFITELAHVFTEKNSAAVFDFSQYLQHQGTVEVALFMLDDYSQSNHQQLDLLVEAIKAKNIEEAQLAISALALNAKILSAQELQFLCVKWSKLLTGSEIPSSLKKINTLLKETRVALNEIDEYAEKI